MKANDIGVITGLEYSDHYIEDLMHCMYDKYKEMASEIERLDNERQMASVDSTYMSEIRDIVNTCCDDSDAVINDTYLQDMEDKIERFPEYTAARVIMPELENHRDMTVKAMVMQISSYIVECDKKTRELEVDINEFNDRMNDQYHYYKDSFANGSHEFPVNQKAADCINANKELIRHAIDYTFSEFSSDAGLAHKAFIKEDLFDYMSGDDLDYIKFMSPIIKKCGEPKGSKSIPTVTVAPQKPVLLDYPKSEPFFADDKSPYDDMF